MMWHQYHVLGKNVHIIILGLPFQKELIRFGCKGEGFLLPNGIKEVRILYKEKFYSNLTVFLTFSGCASHKELDILFEVTKLLIKKYMQFKIQIIYETDTKSTLHQFFLGGGTQFRVRLKLFLKVKT